MSFMNVLLPAPFGPSRPVMPGGTLTDDVVQADDLAVPLRDVVGREDGGVAHGTTSTPRTRRSSTEIDTTTRPSEHEHAHDHRRLVARRLPEDHVGDLRRGCAVIETQATRVDPVMTGSTP